MFQYNALSDLKCGESTAEQSRAEQARGRRRMTRQVTPFHFIGSKGEERRYNRALFEANGGKTVIHGKAGGSIG